MQHQGRRWEGEKKRKSKNNRFATIHKKKKKGKKKRKEEKKEQQHKKPCPFNQRISCPSPILKGKGGKKRVKYGDTT
jgi:hypothetical protein